ncbi:MAG TPA: transposase, partial [Thermoanaerobaculia bacterium]|nr:transposase [Thermoanaerobaculia bacterium]
MGRPLRYIPPGELVEVTNRTFQGRFLLLPTPELHSLALGALGRSQRRFAMPIHGFTFASNHFHLLVTPYDAKHLAEFMGYFQAKLAREVQRLYGWSGTVWSGRYHAIPIEPDARAQIDRLAYVLSHGVKEDLVAHAADWPGANCVAALTKGTPLVGVWHDRSAHYRAARWGRSVDGRAFMEEEKIVLSPLPCWSHLAWSEIHQRIRTIIDTVEAEASNRHRDRA